MKSLKLLATVMTIVNLTACSTNPPSVTGRESYKNYGEQFEDSKIIASIKMAFQHNPLIPSQLIHLSIDRGIVQLSGFVRNHQEADLALMSVKAIPGVKDTINDLVVMSSTEYAIKRAKAEGLDASR